MHDERVLCLLVLPMYVVSSAWFVVALLETWRFVRTACLAHGLFSLHSGCLIRSAGLAESCMQLRSPTRLVCARAVSFAWLVLQLRLKMLRRLLCKLPVSFALLAMQLPFLRRLPGLAASFAQLVMSCRRCAAFANCSLVRVACHLIAVAACLAGLLSPSLGLSCSCRRCAAGLAGLLSRSFACHAVAVAALFATGC